MSEESLAFSMGKIEGQLKELIHQSNNMSQKVDQLSTMAALSSTVPAEVAALNVRVTALEVDRNKRDGATGIVASILKAPSFGWVVGGITAFTAYVTGKLTL